MTGLAHSFVGSSANFAYGFNDAHQLTSQNVSDDQFVWHPASAGTVTYAAANDLNQYPTVGGVSYTYDNNGCLTGDGVWTFGYDVLNRFISAVKSGVSASDLYDPMDRQSQKNVGGTKTRFIYNGLQRIAEYDGTAGTLNTRFVYATGLDEPIVEVSSGGTKTFFHRDRLGSIIARTNNSGAVTQRYEYGPYGESAALSGTSFGFTGQRYDAESGLYNYKARYYSPVIGRFLQPDIIGYADGLNLYAYVSSQPTNFVDPLGTASDNGSSTMLANANGSDVAFDSDPSNSSDTSKTKSGFDVVLTGPQGETIVLKWQAPSYDQSRPVTSDSPLLGPLPPTDTPSTLQGSADNTPNSEDVLIDLGSLSPTGQLKSGDSNANTSIQNVQKDFLNSTSGGFGPRGH